MTDNLPKDHRDVEADYVVGRDREGNELSHQVLAERLMQVAAYQMQKEITEDNDHTSLIDILEGGFRGYDKFSAGELWAEWTDSEDKWFRLLEDQELPWSIYNDDPAIGRKAGDEDKSYD